MTRNDFSPPLDEGIEKAVILLQKGDVETYESCEGGHGHAYSEPTVRFHGDRSEGFRALALVIQHGLHVKSLKRIWDVLDGEPAGPEWELIFWER